MAEGDASNDNPYWHTEGQRHPIDLEAVRLLCFDIFNIFGASEALAMGWEFAEEDDQSASLLLALHHEVAETQALKRLLRLCMLVRTYDDMMSQSKHCEAYAKHAEETSGEDEIGTLDDGALSLREACNKFIHAQEVRAIYEKVTREIDEQELEHWYLSGEIELAGTQAKKSWNAVLYVPPFLETVLDRIGFGWGQ